MRVVFVCQWFDPEPVVVPMGIVRALRRRGAEVEVLTGIPNYPGGRVLPGYRPVSMMTEELDGFVVHRTPLYPSHDSGAGSRLLNYCSWALSSTLLGLRHLRRADVALVYSSPASSALAAMVAKSLFGTPYALLVQDLWPDSVMESGLLPRLVSAPVQWSLTRFVNLSYRLAARVLVTSPGMATVLRSRGVPGEKLQVVYNWVEPVQAGEETDRAQWRANLGIGKGELVVMYAGNHGPAQALGPVIDAMGRLAKDSSARLVLVGEGICKADLVALATRVAPGRVRFLDPVPREQMPSLMAAADVQLVSLADQTLFAVTTPSKLQAIMAAGQPVLASARGDAAGIVIASGAGVVVDPGDAQAFRNALEKLQSMGPDERCAMGARGKTYYGTHMSENIGADRLFAALQESASLSGGQSGGTGRC